MQHNMVPVVYGKYAQYEKHLPPDGLKSHINCADYASAADCAADIARASTERDVYESYHAWRLRYQAVLPREWEINCPYAMLCKATFHNNHTERAAIDALQLRDVDTLCASRYEMEFRTFEHTHP